MASVFNLLPILVVPVIVLGKLDSADAGYYFIAFQIASLLSGVAFAVTQSLLAEVGHAETSLRDARDALGADPGDHDHPTGARARDRREVAAAGVRQQLPRERVAGARGAGVVGAGGGGVRVDGDAAEGDGAARAR